MVITLPIYEVAPSLLPPQAEWVRVTKQATLPIYEMAPSLLPPQAEYVRVTKQATLPVYEVARILTATIGGMGLSH